MGSRVKYFNVDAWKIIDEMNGNVVVKIGEINDSDDITRCLTKEDWELIKSKEVKILTDDRLRNVEWFYNGQHGLL